MGTLKHNEKLTGSERSERSGAAPLLGAFINNFNQRRVTMINGNAVCAPKEQSVASEVLDMTSQVANLALQIAERLESKLGSVMRNSSPPPDCPAEKTCRQYPPLFSEWSSHIASIRGSLEIIDDCIRRTEL
jgi:NTP pyrophosphatase (non-canonical NTP hydrolase)